jgi:hypothetical protein
METISRLGSGVADVNDGFLAASSVRAISSESPQERGERVHRQMAGVRGGLR